MLSLWYIDEGEIVMSDYETIRYQLGLLETDDIICARADHNWSEWFSKTIDSIIIDYFKLFRVSLNSIKSFNNQQ